MSEFEVGSAILALGLLLSTAQLLSYCFEKLKQPRLIGEIFAGVLLGPFIFGKLAPDLSSKIFGAISSTNKLFLSLNFVYWLGLFFLMFISGSETRRLMAKENRKQTAWLLGIGTPLPFFFVLSLGLLSYLPLNLITGTAQNETAALLVLSIAVAVTSIPVISRIFYDLKILHTRFASLVLGSAVLEDIILWGILAVATAFVSTSTLGEVGLISSISTHTLSSLSYMFVGILVAPRLLKYLAHAHWNFFIKNSPVGYSFLILFLYISMALLLKVNLVFAAFLAGFGLVGGISGTERSRFAEPLDAIAKVASGIFIPIYFAIVGYKLVFNHEFSILMLTTFFVGSSVLALLSTGLAARLSGFRGLDIINLAVTMNARGGPGIVLATVAYEAGIINAAFYTTLVLTAVLTSQIAGAWLRYVLSKSLPLLSSNPDETWSLKVRDNHRTV